MFGIGLPELILIMAVALIVVGPDKLPDLARGLAKQFFELKKAANSLKDSLQEEEALSRKPSTNQALPDGYSRPEQLAAAALAGQGRQNMEPGSPRQEMLELVDAAPQPEPVAVALQEEPGNPGAELTAVADGNLTPAPSGEPSGKIDV